MALRRVVRLILRGVIILTVPFPLTFPSSPLESPTRLRPAVSVTTGPASARVSSFQTPEADAPPPGMRAGRPGMPEAGGSLSSEEARRLMDALAAGDPAQTREALRRVLTSRDRRFIAVLIELLRAGQIGLVSTGDDPASVQALEALSGQTFGTDWPAWVEWYGGTRLVPPPGFTGWKARLLAKIDRRFAAFLKDGVPPRIRVEEIQWGGVKVGEIPALTHPAIVPAAVASFLTPQDPVFGLAVNGDARAYPLRIMDWHELVNDVVGGLPISLAYCPLCGTAIAYLGALDGVIHTFGSSGLLFRSNKLMYDDQTHTLWDQLTGEPVLGPLAASHLVLTPLPVVVTTWAAWTAQHPATRALDLPAGYDRPYALGVPYGAYFTAPATMFPVWQRSRLLPAKAQIYAVRMNGVPKAYPLDALVRRRVVNDSVEGTPIVLVATRGIITVTTRRPMGSVDRLSAGTLRYEAGGEVRAFRRARYDFHAGPRPDVLLDESNQLWRVTEDGLRGTRGERLPRISGSVVYWFAWYSFYPRTQVYSP